MGLLTGKYNEGVIPEGSRFAVQEWLGGKFKEYFADDKKEKTIAMFTALKAIAEELGGT